MKINLLKISSSLIIITIIHTCLTGCATVEQTIYLGDAEVKAPFTPPPAHLNINKESGSITFSPKFSVLTNPHQIKGSTGDRYSSSYRINDTTTYRTRNKNLQWTPLKYNLGLDMDIKISNHVSLFGGISTSPGKSISLEGGNIGIGFHNHLENPIIKFDIGLNIQKYEYFAVSIVNTKISSPFGEEEYWGIYGDKGNSVNFNPFLSLTVNSSDETSYLNYFGTIGVFSQSLLDFEPGETRYNYFPLVINQTTVDKRAGYISYSFYASPGLIFSLNEYFRIVVSAKFIGELSTSGGAGLQFLRLNSIFNCKIFFTSLLLFNDMDFFFV